MEFDVAIKVEVVDEKCDKLTTTQNQQNRHETASDRGLAAIKPEPEEIDWCCESSLYVDHQVKDEVVIGPTELHKQSGDSFQDPSVLSCNICTKIYKHKRSYTRHMKTHDTTAISIDKLFEPKNEKQSIRRKEKKKQEISIMITNKLHKIKNKETTEGESDNNNIKLKEIDCSKNKCLLCFKSFTIQANLRRHMSQFHKEQFKKVFSCDKCHMSFSRSDYLIRHKLIKHAEGNKIKICKCGNKFYNRWSYTRHKKGYCVLKTSKPVKLICDYCNKTFCNKYRLTEHIKKHLNNTYKTLVCDYCEKHFHRKFEIERHMLQHLGVSLHKYKCKICNKKFTRNWSLKKHLISHTGKKPFTCRYCMRSFGSQWGCSCHEKRCH